MEVKVFEVDSVWVSCWKIRIIVTATYNMNMLLGRAVHYHRDFGPSQAQPNKGIFILTLQVFIMPLFCRDNSLPEAFSTDETVSQTGTHRLLQGWNVFN